MKLGPIMRVVSGAAMLMFAGSAISQEVTVDDVVSTPGDTTPAISIDYIAGGDVVGFQFDIVFDEGALGTPTPSCNADLGGACDLTCSNPSPGRFRVICFDASLAVQPSGNIGSITFDVPGATPLGVYDLVIDAETGGAGFSDDMGNSVPPANLADGSVTLSPPPGESFYSSNPAIGAEVDFGAAVVNSATGGQTIGVQNLQTDGTAFDITGASGTGTNATIDVTAPGAFPVTVPGDGGATTEDVTYTCTPTVRGAVSGTLAIDNDSANQGPSAGYDFVCAGLAPNVGVTPATAMVSVLALPGGDSDSATYTITNDNSDGFSSSADNVDISIAPQPLGVSPNVSVNPTSFASIAAGGSETFDATCDADDTTVEGTYNFDITVTWDDPVSGGTDSTVVEFVCEVIEALPVYESDPAAGSTLNFGTVTNGITSDPLGIDVGNSDGQGPAPESDLNIISATADNAVFDVTVVNDGPFAAGTGPDGTDDIEVTCTPDSIGTFTGTLTVESDDPANPEATYPLECEGLSDGDFDSTPEPGGVLDLGFAEPGAQTAPGDIDFVNNGDFDDVTVSCTLDDPSGSFSQTPDPIDFTIGPGGTETATFQCIPETADTFTATLTCDIGGDEDVDTADYTILCQGQPLVVPTMGTWGLILLSLMLLAVGGIAGRRMLATRA